MNLRVVGRFHAVEVIGDPSLAEVVVVVEGPHRLERDGDTYVVEGTAEGAGGSASASGSGVNVVVQVGQSGPPVTVRVPASAPVVVDVAAANVTLRDLSGAVRAHVGAGNVRLQRCRGEATVDLEAGSVSVLLGADAGLRLRAVADVGTVTGTDDDGELVVGDGGVAVDVHVGVGSIRAEVG